MGLITASCLYADFYYNFNDDTVGTMPAYLSGAGQVSDAYGLAGNSYNVNGAGAVYIGVGGFGHALDGIPTGSVELDVYAASSFSYFQLLLRDNTNAYKVNLRFSNGYIMDGYSSRNFGDVLTVQQWHHIRVDFSCSANTYTLTLDGVELGTETMNSTTGTEIRVLVLDHLASYDMYYDNLLAERPYYTYSYDFDTEALGTKSSPVFGKYWSCTAGDPNTTGVANDRFVSSPQSLKLGDDAFTGTLYMGNLIYRDFNHGTLSFDYYTPSGLSPTDSASRSDILFKSNLALYIGFVKIYPGINQIQITGDNGTIVAGVGKLTPGAWNHFDIDFDFSRNTIAVTVDGASLLGGYTWNAAHAQYGSAVRSLIIDSHSYTTSFDNVSIKTTPRRAFGDVYDLTQDGAVDMEDFGVFASDFGLTSDEVVPTPWNGADAIDYVASIKGQDAAGDQFCRLGTYEFDGAGNVSVHYWNWSLGEYAANPDSAWALSDRIVGTFNNAIAAGLPEPTFNILPAGNNDAGRHVVSLAKFLNGTSAMASRSATYVQNQRFIDITYTDNGETERWYLSWQEGDNLYKLELLEASYIAVDSARYFLHENAVTGNIERDPNVIATYDVTDSYPSYVNGSGRNVLAAGFAFGSSAAITDMVPVKDIEIDMTGVEVDYGFHTQGQDGIDNPFIGQHARFGYWNDANDVVRYISMDTVLNRPVYRYLTTPASGNSELMSRRVMYQSSHDFAPDGHIENDPGHMIPGLAIIDSAGNFKGMVGVQFFANPTSRWAAASFWHKLPTLQTGGNNADDRLRNGVAANAPDSILYEENFNSYAEWGWPPANRWVLANTWECYVTATNAYDGKSLRILGEFGYQTNYVRLVPPAPLADGRLKFKFRVDPSASSTNGVNIFAQDASAKIGPYYSITAATVVEKSSNTVYARTTSHGQWHSAELVFDTAGGITRLYIDDEHVADGGLYAADAGSVATITFSYVTTENKERLIDDVSLSSFYPKDCSEMILAGFMLDTDFDVNCVVDILDLADFAGHWLEQ